MMYRYLTLNDGTEVVHSDMMPDGRVKVFFERPDERDGFHDATCYLPDYAWESVSGFSDADMERNGRLLKEVARIPWAVTSILPAASIRTSARFP